jgi:hypothetical protein
MAKSVIGSNAHATKRKKTLRATLLFRNVSRNFMVTKTL